MPTKSSNNDDGSTHVTRYSDGSHRSYDRDSDGNKSNDHFKEHSSGDTFAAQTSDDGRYKEGERYDRSGNQVDRPSLQDFNDKHSSSSSDDSGDSRVICTHFFRIGQMSSVLWRADMEFTRRLSPQTVRGYHLWAIPYVRFMRRHSWAASIMLPLAIARAQEVAFVVGVAQRGSALGKIIRLLGEPICWVLGAFVSQQDWQSLYREDVTM